MKGLWQGFSRVPGYVWPIGLIGTLFLDIRVDEGRGAVAIAIWVVAWFFLLSTIVASIAAIFRLVVRRELRPRQVASPSSGCW